VRLLVDTHAAGLPMRDRDPFDRAIVAQALPEDRALVTSDGRLGEYGCAIVC
jgi:PIN domain nuclease of toxin-antitoxin system